MSQNIEIKAFVHDMRDLRERVARLNAEYRGEITQHDTFFRVPVGRLKVRRFKNGEREIIYYIRNSCVGPKKSKYYRLKIGSSLYFALKPFARVWPKKGNVIKSRELFILGDTRIHLDSVEGLGNYLEFEVMIDSDNSSANDYGKAKANLLLKSLCIPRESLLEDAYIDIIRRGTEPSEKKYNNSNSRGRHKTTLRFALWRR